jgi:aryl-alcohol dehydrogenase-like predicted oxidoreductase
MAMRYGNVAGIGKAVSRLVQGTVFLDHEHIDRTLEFLDRLYEMGCNTFDTAHIYANGMCERTIGRWVNERGIREKVVIIGKGAHFNADRERVTPFDITSDLYDSLARFKFDYVDLYLLHRDDPKVPVGPIVEVLNEHHRAGRIRAFGGSNWTHDRVREANEYAVSKGLVPFTASSPHFSLAEQVVPTWRGAVTLTGAQNEAARQWYVRNQMAVLAWATMAGGFFSDKYRRDNIETIEDGYIRASIKSYVGRELCAPRPNAGTGPAERSHSRPGCHGLCVCPADEPLCPCGEPERG